MAVFQMLMAALSVAAAAGGTAGAERLLDRYGRPPAAEAAPAADLAARRDEDELPAD